MEIPEIAAIVAALGVIGLVIFLLRVARRRRRERLEALAVEMGMRWHGDEGYGPMALLRSGNTHLFDQGRGRRYSNLMSRALEDVEVLVFDYRYVRASGNRRRSVSQTVAAFRRDDWGLPHFEIRPEHWGHHIAGLFGFADIDFDEDVEFSRRFLVRGTNPEAVSEFLTAPRRAVVTGLGEVWIEGVGDWLVVYRAGKRRDAEEVRDLVTQSSAVFEEFSR